MKNFLMGSQIIRHALQNDLCYLRQSWSVWKYGLAPCDPHWLMFRIQVIVAPLLVNMSFPAQCLKS